ncbi:hypothetical protein [Wenxinia saemankumensis]|uniref:Uncharacterized protein n=1 Tax=Wenxinia saemankumensis TaxID=1447782 RepID=A0A1M6HFS5_9RHOB|nr:hypothetical protein [Wenxinia saemankumensis]SHJ20959.1 hypothetical protein SAMN05444417_3206 [Wenxinia saemankumensis]
MTPPFDTATLSETEPSRRDQDSWAPPEAPIDMPRQVLEPARGGWSLRRLFPVRDFHA